MANTPAKQVVEYAGGGGIFSDILEYVSQPNGLETLVVFGAVIVIIYFSKWVISRNSSLFKEHDNFRKTLAEDREILREEMKLMIKELDALREKGTEKDEELHAMYKINVSLKMKILELGGNLENLE